MENTHDRSYSKNSTTVPESSLLLRRALTANGCLSAASGPVLVFYGASLSALLGIPAELATLTGVSLLAFAALVLRNGLGNRLRPIEVTSIVAMDAAWVAASALVLAAGVLTTAGGIAVAVVADIVALFAVAQALGLRRARRVAAA